MPEINQSEMPGTVPRCIHPFANLRRSSLRRSINFKSDDATLARPFADNETKQQADNLVDNTFSGNASGTVDSTLPVSQHDDELSANNADTSPWVWNIHDNNIRPVPAYYPCMAEHSFRAVSVPSIRMVAEALSTFVRVHSFLSKYDNQHARMECTTPNLLKLEIQLWLPQQESTQQGNTKNQSSNKIVLIEVRRLRGCCVELQHVRRELFSSLSGMIVCGISSTVATAADNADTGSASNNENISIAERRSPRRPSGRIRQLYQSEAELLCCEDSEAHVDNSIEKTIQEELEHCIDLLCEGNSGTANTAGSRATTSRQQTGCERLCFMTDPSTIQFAGAMRVAQTIIYGSNETGRSLQNALEDCFLQESIPSVASPFVFHHRLPASNPFLTESNPIQNTTIHIQPLQRQSSCTRSIQYLALQALVQSLKLVLEPSEENQEAAEQLRSLDFDTPFWHTIIQRCWYYLEQATEGPCLASLAASCLHMIIGFEGHPWNTEEDKNLLDFALPLVMDAQAYGRFHNLQLERNSQSLLDILLQQAAHAVR